MTDSLRHRLIIWLALCAALVFAMAALGAAVRLTGAGLSIVDWRPLAGALPPLGADDWRRAFAAYQQFPEFLQIHPDMTLAEFRFIFWMEYAHRLLGRIIGAVFLLPLLVLSFWSALATHWKIRLWCIFFLGALQGLLGWYLVQSGLVDAPEVSRFRLTAHLLLAMVIYIALLRALFGLDRTGARDAPDFSAQALVTLLVLLLMLASGGMVAGGKAGLIYNTWPRMGDAFAPDALFALAPWPQNFINNPAMIQFTHRWLAFGVLIAVAGLAWRVWRHDARAIARRLAAALPCVALAQIMLGIAALVLRVPPAIGVLHQMGGMLLLTLVVWVWCLYLPKLD